MNSATHPPRRPRARVVVTLDLDCFYASVAIRSRPHLRTKPVVVVQKHLCVTSNYVARQLTHGAVQKMTPVSKALAACPDLILIDGSDLTPFRAASEEVLNVIRSWISDRVEKICAKVDVAPFECACQKLGFDEVFIDFSRLVAFEIMAGGKPWKFEGHVFGRTEDDDVRRALMVASQLAAELREKIIQDTQLTLCAGVSESKLLAKLAVNMHKPNDQTVFLPGDSEQYVGSLSPRKLPGFGYSTEKKLLEWMEKQATKAELNTAQDIVNVFGQTARTRTQFASILGGEENACKILALCRGIDESPVVESSVAFKSITSMDSFRKCNTMDDVRERVRERVTDLVTRLLGDWKVHNRRPKTLTVGYRLRGRGVLGPTRATSMPTEIVSLCSSKGAHVKDVAIEALQRAALNILSEHAGVSASKKFELTWISIGATRFSDNPSSKPAASASITSFFQKQASPNVLKKGSGREKIQSIPITKPAKHREAAKCPICSCHLTGNMLQVTTHVDSCLRRGSEKVITKKVRTGSDTKRVDSFFSKR